MFLFLETPVFVGAVDLDVVIGPWLLLHQQFEVGGHEVPTSCMPSCSQTNDGSRMVFSRSYSLPSLEQFAHDLLNVSGLYHPQSWKVPSCSGRSTCNIPALSPKLVRKVSTQWYLPLLLMISSSALLAKLPNSIAWGVGTRRHPVHDMGERMMAVIGGSNGRCCWCSSEIGFHHDDSRLHRFVGLQFAVQQIELHPFLNHIFQVFQRLVCL